MKRFTLLIAVCCCALLLANPSPGKAAEEIDINAQEIWSGVSLYEEYCAECHRALDSTTKAQRPARRIRSAIDRFPSMNNLSFLNDQQLEAIASALANIPL